MKAVIVGYQPNPTWETIQVVYRLQDSANEIQSLTSLDLDLDAVTDVTSADIHAKAVAAIIATAAIAAENLDPMYAVAVEDISYLFATS